MSIYSRVRGGQFRLPYAVLFVLRPGPPLMLPSCSPVFPLCSLAARSCSLRAPLLRPLAPPVLPLKRPCSLSYPGTAIPNPKFGVYIIYTYILRMLCEVIWYHPSISELRTEGLSA